MALNQVILGPCSPKYTSKALLVDEEMADQVWEAWDAGEIDDQGAWFMWRWIVKIVN